MAWTKLEATRIVKLQKFGSFRKDLGWEAHQALGFLGLFWSNVVELRESGDIAGWTPAYLAELTLLRPQLGEKAWDALVKNGWLDLKTDGRVLVHNWLEHAGPYLRKKYKDRKGGSDALAAIWAAHGLPYGSQVKEPEEKGAQPLQAAAQAHPEWEESPVPVEKVDGASDVETRLGTDSGPSLSRVSHFTSLHYQKDRPSANSARESAKPPAKAAPEPKGLSPVKTVIDYFHDRCLKVRGFKPSINGGRDGKAVKDAVADGWTVERLKRVVDWFLKSEKCDKLGATLAIALSAHSLTIYSQKMAGDVEGQAAKALTDEYLGAVSGA